MKKPSEYYEADKLQPLEIAIAYNLDFIEGNVLKYICRADHKGQKESDIVKAIDYAKRLTHSEGRCVKINSIDRHQIAGRYCEKDGYLYDALAFFFRALEHKDHYEIRSDIGQLHDCLKNCLNELKNDK